MAKKIKHSRKLRQNVRVSLLILLIPMAVGAFTLVIIFTGLYVRNLNSLGNSRLVTENWEAASATLLSAQPTYDRQFAYYKVKQGQTAEDVAQYFSISLDTFLRDNPGQIVGGTTVKVTPVEKPLEPTSPNGQMSRAVVVEDGNLLRVINKYNLDQPIVTNIPDLMAFLAPYNAITQTGDSSYQLNRAISLDGDIRIDITAPTVTELFLVSTATNNAALVFDESSVLIKDVTISSLDPMTGSPDMTSADGRSFVRMKNGRMDMIDSKISYLGNGLRQTLTGQASEANVQKEGGVYGVSWRISDDQLGAQIATGWVEDNEFSYNHFGAYSYGASGMLWRNNWFYKNEVYGLDPHDDSNNALIENNVFQENGKHGFIVSKRCNYNIIRNNTSFDNKLHGFMLHQDSNYNLIENNVSYNNVDNYVIYASMFNTIRNNESYVAGSSHIRINEATSSNNFVTDNALVGGGRAVYLYGGTTNTYIARNTIDDTKKILQLTGASNTFFGDNTIDNLHYDIGSNDNLIYGVNTVDSSEIAVPSAPELPAGFTAKRK